MPNMDDNWRNQLQGKINFAEDVYYLHSNIHNFLPTNWCISGRYVFNDIVNLMQTLNVPFMLGI